MTVLARLDPCVGSGHAAFASAVLASAADYLVLFGASWWGPGRRTEKHATRVADRYGVALLSVDVEQCPDIARRYQIAGVPSLLLFRNGQIVGRRIGELSERDLEDWIVDTLRPD